MKREEIRFAIKLSPRRRGLPYAQARFLRMVVQCGRRKERLRLQMFAKESSAEGGGARPLAAKYVIERKAWRRRS